MRSCSSCHFTVTLSTGHDVRWDPVIPAVSYFVRFRKYYIVIMIVTTILGIQNNYEKREIVDKYLGYVYNPLDKNTRKTRNAVENAFVNFQCKMQTIKFAFRFKHTFAPQ